MTPTADDLAEIADLQVAEALDAAESRGLVPPGWASDESRAWACVLCDGTGVAGWSPYGTAIQSACGACAVRVTLGSRIVTRGGDGTQRTPNTTDDLCAVLAIDWHRAEVLAREVVRELRQYGHRGGDVRVVWRVVKMEPCGEHDLISPTLVTRQADDLRAFPRQHGDIILKPLDGMGGMGIFRVGPDGLNLGGIIETLNRDGAQSVMVQRYIPEITQGDKRVLVIAGEVVPYCLARIPQGGEVRGNLAAGGKGVAQPVSESDLRIAQTVAQRLQGRGLLLMGLDIIGACLTEINVTSPTCFREIMDQTGCDVGALFWDGLTQCLQS